MRLTQSFRAGLALVLASVSLVACSPTPDDAGSELSDYSNSELRARDIYLEELAAASGIDNPPDIALVRFVSAQEWAGVQIECMNSAGFPVTLLADGQGIDASAVPEVQRHNGGPFQLAKYECEARYTVDPSANAGLSDVQLGLLYDWYVNESIPCLEAQGVTVFEAPSKQTFVETYFSMDGWFPYASVDAMTMPDVDWSALNIACPQAPPDDVLVD